MKSGSKATLGNASLGNASCNGALFYPNCAMVHSNINGSANYAASKVVAKYGPRLSNDEIEEVKSMLGKQKKYA